MRIKNCFHEQKEYDGLSSYPNATRVECSNSCLAFFRSIHHE
jgi:hypothetical protein